MQCSRVQDDSLTAEKLEVLYGEADGEVRARVEGHLRECGACRNEMAALRRLRQDLRAWTLDEPRPRPAFSPSRRRLAWLAAAAVTFLSLGAGLAAHGYVSLRHDLAALEARALKREREHRAEIVALREALKARPTSLEGDPLLARVNQQLDRKLRASDERQEARLRASLAEWTAQMEAQRRVDLARVAAGLSYLDGRHGQQLARTNEVMGYVLEAASQKR